MKAFYNEIEPYCCAWLQNLMDKGLITPGTICDTPVQNLTAEDVKGYDRCHFFAGIAGWEIALQIAGWGDRPVWTGSAPCQPFSVAGKGKAQADERHLWPHWFKLIAAIRPPVVFGEQVAGAITHGWWDDAADDLEREGYETGACVLPACSIGAPHKRDRLWFVGYSKLHGLSAATQPGSITASSHDNAKGEDTASKSSGASERRSGENVADSAQQPERKPADQTNAEPACGKAWDEFKHSGRVMADAAGAGLYAPAHVGIHSGEAGRRVRNEQSERCRNCGHEAIWHDRQYGCSECHGECESYVADADHTRPQRHGGLQECACEQSAWARSGTIHPGWQSDAGICRISHGIQHRASKLRAYGNAIVPQIAAEFIAAYMDCAP